MFHLILKYNFNFSYKFSYWLQIKPYCLEREMQ